MITLAAAALLGSIASAALPAPAAAPAVHASTSAAPTASAAAAFGVSTYTVSTLYTGDQVRDPFLPPGHAVTSIQSDSGDDGAKTKSHGVDIHVLELRGIMKDDQSAFALFSTDTGATLILRGSRLYDEHNKRVPGITGSINIKQKRAVLITADKDRQPYHLGEIDTEKKGKDSGESNESEETGSGRSP